LLRTRNQVYNQVDVTTLPLSEAKAKLAQLLREAEELGERFVITRSGRPAAVLVSAEEYDGLLETLEILADPDLVKGVRAGLRDLERGRTVRHDELWEALDAGLRR